MDKNVVLYKKLWNFALRKEKHGRLTKTLKLMIYNEKKNNGNIPNQKFINKYIA